MEDTKLKCNKCYWCIEQRHDGFIWCGWHHDWVWGESVGCRKGYDKDDIL